MTSDGTYPIFNTKSDGYSYIEDVLINPQAANRGEPMAHASYALGATSGILAGKNGAGVAVSELNTLQRTSKLNNLGLDYSSKINTANNIVKGLKLAGYAASGLSVYLSYNQFQSGEIDQYKFALDVFMTGYSHIPIIGQIGGLLYYSIDNLYPGGIYGFGQDYSNQQMNFYNSVGASMTTFMR
jgi:hypothetical protein